ncbi:AAA family ATPase [Nostoc sp. CHAB 5834]|nr:AAA family ATPase [Nostoc sp. CHAB 5834]
MENTTPDTNNFLNWVEIKNFKSIKDLRFDCKRVNVFIGKPNVGKSNILEGLGLLGGSHDDNRYLNGALRYATIKDLFTDNSTEQPIEINTNQTSISLRLNEPVEYVERDRFELRKTIKPSSFRSFIFDESGAVSVLSAGVFSKRDEREYFETHQASSVKKYDFAHLNTFSVAFSQYLLPPHGANMYAIINRNTELWNEFATLFLDQGLEFVLSDSDQTFVLQKKIGQRVKQYPFFSIADTFRRFMFYITAIESNKNSVIIFEEPEVHSFPPYVKTMAHRIVDSDENQFFISTHSPYLLQTLIRELDASQLSVFITYYKDYQTCVRPLTANELREAEDLSIDLFYNLSRYEPNA